MPGRAKNYFLLLASLFFYAWGEPRAVFVMLLSIMINYVSGRLMERSGNKRNLKAYLTLAVIFNIGILFIFKYLTFVTDNLEKLSKGTVKVIDIALPIGISFYTFQGLSYVIDVYRSRKNDPGKKSDKVIRNPFELALYISMFPQLIAGPIVRFSDIAGQLKERTYSAGSFSEGVKRFITGLSKKVILANNVGLLADRIFTGDYDMMSCPVAWLGTLAYTLQIYMDFSAYSDMAIGLGKMLGFTFPENFNKPYISRSVSEFWRRWHMSLSGWFRDYVYIPLGGSRKGNVYLNLLAVFVLTGIWHGAGWGFLIWGLWHGAFVIAERFVKKHSRSTLQRAGEDMKKASLKTAGMSILGWAYAMLVVMMGWTLFRIAELGPFLKYLAVLLTGAKASFTAYGIRYYLSDQNIIYLILSIVACIPVKDCISRFTEEMKERKPAGKKTDKMPGENAYEETNEKYGKIIFVYIADILQKAVLLILLVLCFMYMINSTYNPFIYFRF